MAAVSVFVDDAIRGRLPLVCAKTGEPADLVVRVRHPVGGGAASMAWLLLFLGPPGWAAFFLVAILAPGQEYLTVRIPETDASYNREKRLERSRIAVFGMGLALVLYGIIFQGMFPALWLVSGAACLVAALVLHFKVTQQNIGISLDASRRWVTLSGVHPNFVHAVQIQEVGGTARF